MNINNRHFSPLFVALCIASAALVSQVLSAVSKKMMVKMAMALVAIWLGWNYGNKGWNLLEKMHREGTKYTHRKWIQSETLARVKDLPLSALLYTNNPAPIYLLAGRSSFLLPRKYHRSGWRPGDTYRVNKKNLHKLEKLRQKMVKENGYYIYFNTQHQWYNIPLEELEEQMGLVLVEKVEDGAIYQVRPESI